MVKNSVTQEELIGKIRELRQIKPRKDWVLFTKSQILPQEQPVFTPFFIFKPVFAGVLFVFILFGLLGTSQNSLPGDLLYPIKKITEKARVVFVSETEKPKANLELANKRLEEINQIAQNNEVRKLVPAINEFQASILKVTENLTALKGADIKEIAKETQKLEENKKKAESLGIEVGETEELESAYKILAEREIKNLEQNSLTETQEEVLKEAKEYFEKGDFATALIKIVEASQIK
jgi:hypothetical protein